MSVLAPQAVRTAMTAGIEGGGVAGVDGMLEPDVVADAVVRGLASEAFLILPHPQVLEYFRRKASDYDRWISGHAAAAGTVRRFVLGSRQPTSMTEPLVLADDPRPRVRRLTLNRPAKRNAMSNSVRRVLFDELRAGRPGLRRAA